MTIFLAVLSALTAASPLLVSAAGWLARTRRGPLLSRPVTLTDLRWTWKGQTRPSIERTARTLRRAAVAFCAFNLALASYQFTVVAHSHGTAEPVLAWVMGTLGVWAAIVGAIFAVNIDVRRCRENAFSRHRHVLEVGMSGKPPDVLTELHRFLRRQGAEIVFSEWDRVTGLLILVATKVRLGFVVVPQHLVVVGSICDGKSFQGLILADTRPAVRYDGGQSERVLRRVVRHFSSPPGQPAQETRRSF